MYAIRSYYDGESFCGLMARETDTLKKEALKMLIFSGQGCSHKYGPHPRITSYNVCYTKLLRYSLPNRWQEDREHAGNTMRNVYRQCD